MSSAHRGSSDDKRERLAATIDAIYDDFVAKVAQGRGRTIAEIENVARGRVWTSSGVVGGSLVDVEPARSSAGISTATVNDIHHDTAK